MNVTRGSAEPSTASAQASAGRQTGQLAAEAAALAVVLAVGAYLRLAALDFAQFRVDDFTLWGLARRVAEQPRLLTQGMDSSLGIANGPFQAYLLLPATVLSASPIAPYFVVALLNVLGVGLFWAFVRSYWGAPLASVAALLFAVNPWAVVFARRLLGNDLVAPFTVLLVWSLCDLARHGRRRDGVLPFLWLAIVVQVYVVALVHLLLAALGLALGARRLRPAPLIGGLLLFGALTAPYLVGTLLPNLSALSSLVGQAGSQPEVDATSARFMLLMVSAEGYQVFATQIGAVVDATRGLPLVASLLAQGSFVIGLAVGLAAVARHWRRRTLSEAAPYLLPVVAVLLPVLLLVRHTSPVYTLYLVTALPMPYLFVALGLRAVWRVGGKVARPRASAYVLAARVCSASVAALVVATHLFLGQVYLSVIREYWPQSDHGLPLRYTLEIGDTIRALLGQPGSGTQSGFARAYIGGSGERDAVLYGTLKPELPDLFHFNSAEGFIRPNPDAGRVLYVLSSTEDQAAAENRIAQAFSARFGGSEVASLVLPGSGVRYSFYSVSSAELAGVLADLSPSRPYSARLGDYLELVGYDVPAEAPADRPIRIGLAWRVLARPPEDVNVFVHLIGGLGSQWGQWNGLGHPLDQWREGDTLVEWHEVEAAPGAPPVEYQVEVGAYPRSTGQRLPVATDKGADDRLRLGAVRLGRPATQPPLSAAMPVDVRFGDSVRLRSYDLSSQAALPGDRLKLTLHWESLAQAPADYTVFVHLVGADPRPVAQADSPPAHGAFPTGAWQPGDVVSDPREIALPADIAPGRYWLLVGLYVPQTGQRVAPIASPPSLFGRLGAWLERRTPYRAGPRVDGDRAVLAAVDVQARR